jgi:hypothetical protein
MDETLRDKIAQEIRAAFSSTPYSGDDNIGGDDPFDGVLVEQDFKGKHWRDITLEILLKHHNKLPFLSPQGYRYYLPAYLLGVLYHFEDVDLDVLPSKLIRTLSPNHHQARFLEVTKQFTVEESAAIYSFLSHYKELFPEESWSYLDNEGQELDEAIEYWKYAQAN